MSHNILEYMQTQLLALSLMPLPELGAHRILIKSRKHLPSATCLSAQQLIKSMLACELCKIPRKAVICASILGITVLTVV